MLCHFPTRAVVVAAALGVAALGGQFSVADDARQSSATPAASAVDYLRHVKPLLEARCYKCHGPTKQEAGLRLHAKAAALAGGDSGAVIKPGHSGESLLVQRIAGLDGAERMPPADAGPPLSAEQIALVRAWIDQGAKWPDGIDAGGVKGQDHWAYKKPLRQPLPAVRHADWPRQALDAFIAARHDQEGLQAAAETDRARWLRRTALDLIGLPPSLDELDEFLADSSPDAHFRAVDRLLASPRYGERWAAPWLDRARYADTQGYEKDNRRTIWRYRDWVIDALNRNLPFDQFTIEQLAGDLLPNATLDQRIATAFHRNTMTNTEGGTDNEEFRVAAVVDRVNTTFEVWMATTMGCCQCHSHKYDPFTQREYYQFFAYFNQTADADVDDESPRISTPTRLQQRELARLQSEIARLEAVVDKSSAKERFSASRPERQTKSTAQANAKLPLPPEPLSPAEQLAEWKRRVTELQSLTTPVMVELNADRRRATHVLIRGNFLNPGEKVTEGVPAVLHPLDPQAPKNRVGAAQWIVHRDNPLTARVTVNRLWEQLFGIGIVETAENFGTQGEPPSHPELLDHLAVELMDGGWDVKMFLRSLVTSATYRQSSAVTPAGRQRDPFNRLLARGPRNRLSAEQLRDQALAVSGLLSTKMFGPSVMPPQPPGVWQVVYSGDTWVTAEGEDRYRRGVYTFWRRTSPHPAMTTFDAPSREYCVVRRSRTNTPLQALVTLNDPALVEAARALARRTLAVEGDVLRRVEWMFRACVMRPPKPAEASRLAALYQGELAHFQRDAAAANALVGDSKFAPLAAATAAEWAAWTVVANVILNLDEVVTKG